VRLVWKEAIMGLLVLVFLVALPVSSFAQYVGDLSPNPLNNNSIGNPFSPGGPWSPTPPRNPPGARTAPTSPYTWSNPLAVGPPQMFEGGGQFRMISPLNQNQTGTSLGPYGMTLPPGHPLGRR
jgi:hypothetical protein